MRPCWKKQKLAESRRLIKANDSAYNNSFNYENNRITTSKYSALSFLPKNLFEQFQRIANAYFLVLLILQLIPQVSSLSWVTTFVPLLAVMLVTAIKDILEDSLIPEISSLTPLTTVIPLIAVLAISAIKDAVDDIHCDENCFLIVIVSKDQSIYFEFYKLFNEIFCNIDGQRHRSDNQVNNRLSSVLRDGKLVEELWYKVVVGDIIKMENNHFVAADLLLLSTSEPNGLCYVETAELDGETNLKVRQTLTVTTDMIDIEQLSKFDGEIVCEPPNNQLNKFEGSLTLNNETYALDNEQILLRGCVLRNTQWCYGLVIFAGKESKLMMNSGRTTFKRTHIDRLMNVLIVGIFVFLLLICCACTILSGVWESVIGYHFQIYLPWEHFVPGSLLRGRSDDFVAVGSTVTAMLVFLSYAIVLNTVVPISLYVSMEMIRFGHSWWINWDQKMYYAPTDTPAKARTTTLNEELGQIEFVFSDKTGTLTENIMTFNKCTINGKIYGYLLDDDGQCVEITERTQKVDFSDNPMYEPSFRFYDQQLWEAVKVGNPHVHMFFRLLALCHTVMPEDKDGILEYQAQSPDEGALVSAARNFGFVFKARTQNSITIEVMGRIEVYELLCILDFNNDRKRMSVILKKDDRITLYCKGADSTVYPRLNPKCAELQVITTSHLNEFAQSGLRTLCCAVKDIDPSFYAEWQKRYSAASIAIGDREERLSVVYNEIEENMALIGASAVEDKLQDGVPETIANLILADIKIWVLTGDKQETAVNIGYSCRLLTDEMEEVFTIDGESYEVVLNQLKCAQSVVSGEKIPTELDGNGAAAEGRVDTIMYSNGSLVLPITVVPTKNGATTRFCLPDDGCPPRYALVINGQSLVHALDSTMEELLVDVACRCHSVICCRVTPLQKALVVDLIKRRKSSVTLAIGDGANDVSMIKTAHIGVGISGQEGKQAVLASDFALARFAYLERLLLVHGRWSYLRMCKFLQYFFYKNFAFTLCHVWFAFFCGFSAQTLYDEAFISLYNVVYTSLPILALGIFDQDVNDLDSVRYPKLYTPGHCDLLFNKKVFVRSVVEGIVSSLVLFFMPYFAFYNAVKPDGRDIAGHKAFGCVVASSLIVTVTLRSALDTSYWTGFNHFVIWGSLLFYFGFTFFFYSELFDYAYLGTAVNVMGTATFWFTLILVVAVLLIPVTASRFYLAITRPTLADRVRLKLRISKSKSKSGELIPRQASTRRSMRSSGRSGYAFAHEEGFGQLITTGSMIRFKKRRTSTANSLKSCLPIGIRRSSSIKEVASEVVMRSSRLSSNQMAPPSPTGPPAEASLSRTCDADYGRSSSRLGVGRQTSTRSDFLTIHKISGDDSRLSLAGSPGSGIMIRPSSEWSDSSVFEQNTEISNLTGGDTSIVVSPKRNSNISAR